MKSSNPSSLAWLFSWLMILLVISLSGCAPARTATTTAPVTPDEPVVTATAAARPSATPEAATPEPTSARLSASEKETQNWRSYPVTGYGFDFLYPVGEAWVVTEMDALHVQIRYQQAGLAAVLTVGYRDAGEEVELAPKTGEQVELEWWSSFDFLGEYLPVKVVLDGSQEPKAIWFDGGEEKARAGRFFTLRLEVEGQDQSLSDIEHEELMKFHAIVGSFRLIPHTTSHPVGSTVNLARLGLAQTESIEIAVFNPQFTPDGYLYQHLINDPALISRLAAALDHEVLVEPAPEGIPAYELTFHLADRRQVVFRYHCCSQSSGLVYGTAADGSLAIGGMTAVQAEFEALLLPELEIAEELLENTEFPRWKSRIVYSEQPVGPFMLEEYLVLDKGRWAPYMFEFLEILPGTVFEKRAGMRERERQPWRLPKVTIGSHTYEVTETWGGGQAQNYATVLEDGQEIYRIPVRIPAGVSAVRGFWAWQDQWVLEVEGHILINGVDLNDRFEAQESFAWQIMDGEPSALLMIDGELHVMVGDELYPLGYDDVVHNTCCEAGVFNVGHNNGMYWFYAHKDGLWRYVELVLRTMGGGGRGGIMRDAGWARRDHMGLGMGTAW